MITPLPRCRKWRRLPSRQPATREPLHEPLGRAPLHEPPWRTAPADGPIPPLRTEGPPLRPGPPELPPCFMRTMDPSALEASGNGIEPAGAANNAVAESRAAAGAIFQI